MPDGADAQTLLRSGAELISDNSGEALGNDRKELEAGIARVERALAEGVPDRFHAYRLLAQAFNALHSRIQCSQQGCLSFLRKEGDALRELSKLKPGEPSWAMAYVDTLVDPEKKIEELRRVASEFKAYVPARVALASQLCESGHADEGMKEAVRMAETLSADEIDTRGGEIIGIGFGCLGHAGSEKISAILERRMNGKR